MTDRARRDSVTKGNAVVPSGARCDKPPGPRSRGGFFLLEKRIPCRFPGQYALALRPLFACLCVHVRVCSVMGIDKETQAWFERLLGQQQKNIVAQILEGQEEILERISEGRAATESLRADMGVRFNVLTAEMNGRFDIVESELRALGAAERDNARDVLGLQEKAGA